MDITFILDFIITLAVTLTTAFLLPYLKEKLGEQKVKNAYEIIKILVEAIEQTTTITGQGKAKKEWVLNRLKDYNLSINEKQVNEMIESAVLELNKSVE